MRKSLVLRTVDSSGLSYGGFKWPKLGLVKCKDWNPDPVCGSGLHGLLWGQGSWNYLSPQTFSRIWQVVEVTTKSIVHIDKEKVKFKQGNIIYSGTREEALKLVLTNKNYIDSLRKLHRNKQVLPNGIIINQDSPSKYQKTIETGHDRTAINRRDSGIAIAIMNSEFAISTGLYGTAISDVSYSSATTFNCASSAVTVNVCSTALCYRVNSQAITMKEHSTAIVLEGCSHAIAKGINSLAISLQTYNTTVQAGAGGIISSLYYDTKLNRKRLLVGYIGEKGLKPDIPYHVVKGKWKIYTTDSK